MKSLLLAVSFVSILAKADRQLGFLVPIGDEQPLDVKKFQAVECQYEVMCYPVYAIKELKSGKKIFEIRRLEVSGEPQPLVREGELPFNYQPLDVYLNTAMLDFIGKESEIAASPDQMAKPVWMNFIEHSKPLGVVLSKKKKDLPTYEVVDKPGGKKISATKVSWSNVMNWTYAVCDKMNCQIPYFEIVDGYFKVLAPPPKQRAPASVENFNKISGEEPKYVWLKDKNLDGKTGMTPSLTEKTEADMFKPNYPLLKDVDVVAVKSVGTQLWLQVDFLEKGRCDGAEKKVIGRGWIPVFRSDDSLNFRWYPRGC